MTDNIIKLGEDDTLLRLKIYTKDGEDTGEMLVFDLEDIELPLKYQELAEQNKKNKQWIRNQMLIISKRQDVKGKKLMSKNQEDEIKAINEFYKREIETMNGFLGKNGVQKLLNGRNITWTSLAYVEKIIEEQIAPYFDGTMDKIKSKIKATYGVEVKEEDEIEVVE